MNREINYIDLFCGAGGLSLGFSRQGYNNIFSVDIEPSFCETYKYNFPTHRLLQMDITKLSSQDIIDIVGNRKVDIVVGGPPCQGFSMAGNIGRKFIDDPRNHLFKEFARIVELLRPTCFVMENVARLYTYNQGEIRQQILNTFASLGYSVSCSVLNAADFGVPQYRYRVVFIGILKSLGVKKIEIKPTCNPNEYKTVRESIESLPRLESAEESNIPNHIAMTHTQQMLNKMAFVKDGGDRYDIPEIIRPKKGDARKYIRYASNKPSVCITGDMRKVFHYEQNRALTVRELARIQSYPDDFIFKGSVISQQQQVGNSVPPLLAEAIAKELKYIFV